MAAIYDTIGVNYADLRKPDPRIAATMELGLFSWGMLALYPLLWSRWIARNGIAVVHARAGNRDLV